MKAYVHPSAIVEHGVELQDDVKVWHMCHVRHGSVLEQGVSLGKDVYIDADLRIGRGTRIQNGVSLFRGVKIDPWVFIGPHVIFTNDMFPRAGNKGWNVIETQLHVGAAIGAGAIIRCGVRLEPFSMVAAGAMVTRSVPAFHLVVGLPARPVRMVCACGQTQKPLGSPKEELMLDCCKENMHSEVYLLALEVLRQLKPAELKVLDQ